MKAKFVGDQILFLPTDQAVMLFSPRKIRFDFFSSYKVFFSLPSGARLQTEFLC